MITVNMPQSEYYYFFFTFQPPATLTVEVPLHSMIGLKLFQPITSDAAL